MSTHGLSQLWRTSADFVQSSSRLLGAWSFCLRRRWEREKVTLMVADDVIKVGSNMGKPRCPAHSSYDILALQSQSQSHPQHITLYSQSKYLQAIKHGNEQSTIYRWFKDDFPIYRWLSRWFIDDFPQLETSMTSSGISQPRFQEWYSRALANAAVWKRETYALLSTVSGRKLGFIWIDLYGFISFGTILN
jgi:hypothetical protein